MAHRLDERRIAAIAASRAWYELTFGLHDRRFRADEELWIGQDPPPPWHSGALTLQPGLSAQRVVAALGTDFAGSIADNFAELELADHGFAVLFDATWIHAGAPPPVRVPAPDWSVITSAAELFEWSERHDYHGVLTAEVLSRPDLRVLQRIKDGRLTGGCVLHRTGDVVAVSNVWADREPPGWGEIMIMAGLLFPGHALVGYERGKDLTNALAAGFDPVGPHRVWRSAD